MGELIDRLVACGFSESEALDICYSYEADNCKDALRSFVRCNELFYSSTKKGPSDR